MPWHFHPLLRSLEKAEESLGLIKSLNSVGYTVQLAEEQAGTSPAPALSDGFFWFLGQKITPSA